MKNYVINSKLLLVGIIFLFKELRPVALEDVYGCHDLERETIAKYGEEAKRYHWYPKCLTGGYYQNVQCNFGGCYCAYLDTGLQIPNTYENLLVQYMKDNCPWLANKMPDPCTPPPKEFPCKAASTRFYFNPASGECEEGSEMCLGFETQESCAKSCVVKKRHRCNFRASKGITCDRRKPGERWYHDEDQGSCRPFYYEGCGGNSNNYREKWTCLKTCERIHTAELIIQVEKTKYIIGLPTWLVVKNLYVPSAPNVITFDEFKEIEGYMTEIARFPSDDKEREGEIDQEREQFRPEHAPKNMSIDTLCNQKKQSGPCRALMPRWYFDKKQSKCVKFIYGGCLGNANRHKTAQGCAFFCNAKVKPSAKDKFDDLIATGGKGPFGTLAPPIPKPDNKGKLDGSRDLDLGPPIPPGAETTTAEPETTRPAVVESGEEAEVEFILE
ncbi:actinia tenebrosa protease inhibitors-like [Styela clava]|uniref:papilin-like n=1 Tax=Styela clava TaxID=7725 RepID=UPI001939F179|nr:papilin-like [Styela clava]